jgi:hypothetical protein
MFRANWPSSGVQVVMVRDSAAHCNAGFFPPVVATMAEQHATELPAPGRTFKLATTNKTTSNHVIPRTNKTDGNPHNQNNQRQLQ